MIKLKDVSKHYYLGEEVVKAVNDVTLEIKEKEYISILGSSGSGKSTLMHMIGLLDKPTSGRIKIFNKDIAKLHDDEVSKMRSKYIGFVFQQYNLIEKMTVLENVLLPVMYGEIKDGRKPKDRAMEVLERLGIHDRADFYPNKISGGQQQRAAIARALIMEPKLILADEPTGNLDTVTGNEIMKLLEELNRDLGVTIAIVTHEAVIAKRTNRQIYMRDGQVVKKYI